jgi:hypothetical protein
MSNKRTNLKKEQVSFIKSLFEKHQGKVPRAIQKEAAKKIGVPWKKIYKGDWDRKRKAKLFRVTKVITKDGRSYEVEIGKPKRGASTKKARLMRALLIQ